MSRVIERVEWMEKVPNMLYRVFHGTQDLENPSNQYQSIETYCDQLTRTTSCFFGLTKAILDSTRLNPSDRSLPNPCFHRFGDRVFTLSQSRATTLTPPPILTFESSRNPIAQHKNKTMDPSAATNVIRRGMWERRLRWGDVERGLNRDWMAVV